MGTGATNVLTVAALVVLGGCAGPPDAAPTPSPTGPTASVSGAADAFAALRRPWAHPPVAAGATCPVATEVQRPDPGLGPLLGTGPARPAGVGTGAVLHYESPTRGGTWTDRTWGGQKVLWAVDPATTGPVLVRGRQLDGQGGLAFEDPAQPELRLNTGSYEGQTGGWRDYPSFTRVKAPGCYAYQVDTGAGTWSIVFTARGPVV
ncbi:hypothetical protein Voc01_075100 [Virgisporangium ochraceum]|uniref:Lipoprotein n=1 Tax=Virgisporangium ochraceum TaxID=65505 RepID=A0A8J4A1W9_9ACTN|nr:hypothetical protein Voc01_075100 [Virgisporangium ochraceum]